MKISSIKNVDKLIRFLTSELHAIVNRKILNCWHMPALVVVMHILPQDFVFICNTLTHSHSPPFWHTNASHRRHTNGGSGLSVQFVPIFKHIINANIPFIQSRSWFFRFLFFLNTPTPLLCGVCPVKKGESAGERARERVWANSASRNAEKGESASPCDG